MTTLVEGLRRRSRHIDTIGSPGRVCVFGGSKQADEGEIADAAVELGRLLALEGIGLVYGGEEGDLTGSVARAAAENGGMVTAVVQQSSTYPRNSGHFADEVVVVPGFQARKRAMFDRADVLIALPGGVGAIEELSEVIALHKDEPGSKPLLIANFGRCWSPLFDLFMYLRCSGYICGEGLEKCLLIERPQAVLSTLHTLLAPRADMQVEARMAAFA
ncbi:TIGR00730 family Rossman fold protein [Mesorhizobium sp. NPDC059054]|uniref:LOG family protein n=1 Tax=Mesorhizobium sp. NPDC059054 TaxID=3346711 RepID=UPI003693C571